MKKLQCVDGKTDTFVTRLKVGDTVMVLTGGNKKKQKLLRGQTGKILRFLPKTHRVVVEGLNMITRHKRARTSNEVGGKIVREGSVHISNVMFYSEEHKRPLRLKVQSMADGRKVRGITDPKTKKFQALEA